MICQCIFKNSPVRGNGGGSLDLASNGISTPTIRYKKRVGII